MVSESIEYVGEYFDDTFMTILENKLDARIFALRKYTKSLINMRKKRVGNGSVIVTLQTFDSLKYLEPCALNIIKKIENNEIKMHENEKEVCNVIIASFGDNNSASGWSGKVSEFIEIVSNANGNKDETPGSNRYYLRNFPETIIKNKKDVNFIIFGTVIHFDNEFYDTAAINIIGIPEDREEDIRVKQILSLFGYDN